MQSVHATALRRMARLSVLLVECTTAFLYFLLWCTIAVTYWIFCGLKRIRRPMETLQCGISSNLQGFRAFWLAVFAMACCKVQIPDVMTFVFFLSLALYTNTAVTWTLTFNFWHTSASNVKFCSGRVSAQNTFYHVSNFLRVEFGASFVPASFLCLFELPWFLQLQGARCSCSSVQRVLFLVKV